MEPCKHTWRVWKHTDTATFQQRCRVCGEVKARCAFKIRDEAHRQRERRRRDREDEWMFDRSGIQVVSFGELGW